MSARASAESADAGVILVGLGEMAVTADVHTTLITYALGSCLGVAVYDPHARVGGMLHAMMPRAAIDPARALAQPAMFVDTGVPALFRACYTLGARKDRMIVYLAGAASIHAQGEDAFRIGSRNLLTVRQLFDRNGVAVREESVGGTAWRNLSLTMATGDVLIGQAPRRATAALRMPGEAV